MIVRHKQIIQMHFINQNIFGGAIYYDLFKCYKTI